MSAASKIVSGLLFACVVVTAPLLGGCPNAGNTKFTGSGMDIFTPATMRVHPLTRIVASQTQKPIEIHIEFTDQFGDVGKCVGSVSLAVDQYAMALPGNRGDQIESWNIDLTTPAENKQYWDPITRTYTFKLASKNVSAYHPGEKYVVVADMTLPNDAHLHESLTVTASKNS